MMKKNSKTLLIILFILCVITAVGLVFSSTLKSYNEKVAAITLAEVDLTRIEDGVYTGSYDTTLVSAEVKVTIKDHQITQIDLIKHSNGKGASAEVLPDKVVEAQSLDVDVISGATASSKVILKAIEKALNNGLK